MIKFKNSFVSALNSDKELFDSFKKAEAALHTLVGKGNSISSSDVQEAIVALKNAETVQEAQYPS
jgi:hypothetical protein